MVPSNSARLVRWFARSSFPWNLYDAPPATVNELLTGGGYRSFATSICRSFTVIGNLNSKDVNTKNWLQFGVLEGKFRAIRSIHGTASLMKDYYDVLGVSKNATSSEIKKAFYALAKKHHPDMNKEDTDAEKKFQEINKAYEVLKDEQERAAYDQLGHDAYEQNKGLGGGADPRGGGFSPFEDIFRHGFEDVFKIFEPGFRPGKFGGQDVKVTLELSFMEAVQGCTKTVTFQTNLPCDACGGTGVPPGTKPETCRRCKGRGMTFMQNGPFSVQSTCMHCGGTGKTFMSHCKTCNGNRVVRGSKTIKLDVMPGVDNNETIKVTRSGGADPDGYDPGDLYVTIKVRDDPVFRREGSDIHVDAILSITQAILGGTIQVPTLTGDVVLKVSPGTQPGQKVALKRKGIKGRGSFSYGDQYVHFNVSIPMNLTPRQRELVEELAREEQGEYDRHAAAGHPGENDWRSASTFALCFLN
ncbi:hypothetical protein Nepgr_032498 [Nepenthes gracilis]|uniref:Uncharacterized protein n=1 Tax=Nepenthes gracilis TaxID=150966 RepID=A0AAD3TJD1_NEPGR|nr:hypothetical protein Nepgr_032498 [Nepenthes gracilis]